MQVIEQEPLLFKYVRSDLQDRELCMRALINPKNFSIVKKELQDLEMCIYVLNKDKSVIRYFNHELRSRLCDLLFIKYY
jgi:hypothetical protein